MISEPSSRRRLLFAQAELHLQPDRQKLLLTTLLGLQYLRALVRGHRLAASLPPLRHGPRELFRLSLAD